MDEITLMFLYVHNYDGQVSYRGAFLSTDANTTPIEFRCTNVIKPTKLQVTLYGKVLEEHIYVELIGSPLLNSANKKPDIIIAMDKILLNMREKFSIPVVFLQKETDIHIPESDQYRQIITSETGKFEPVIMIVHQDYPDDKKFVGEKLTGIFSRKSLLEPFERIQIALEEVDRRNLL
jgi:hypothetical protein